jgi:hypothetical protein
MNHPRLHRAGLLAVLALGGCSSGQRDADPTDPLHQNGASVVLTTGATSYHAGDRVGLIIESRDSEPLYYNACTRSLELKLGSLWIPGPESLRLCSRELFEVQPGATRRDTTDLDLGLEPAEYRIVLGFGRVGEGQASRIASNAFTIEP